MACIILSWLAVFVLGYRLRYANVKLQLLGHENLICSHFTFMTLKVNGKT